MVAADRGQGAPVRGESHFDFAAVGEAISTSQSEASKSCSMEDHRPVLADKLVVSRQTRRARGRYQGFANRSNPVCNAADARASSSS